MPMKELLEYAKTDQTSSETWDVTPPVSPKISQNKKQKPCQTLKKKSKQQSDNKSVDIIMQFIQLSI